MKKKGDREVPAMSTTSLPDVVYIILFFFMLSTSMRDQELIVSYKMPEATAATIDENGWLHSGDLACRDADGNYRITGRHILALNVAHGTNPLLANTAYFAQRIKPNLIPFLKPEMYVTADLSYYVRTPIVNGRITIYNTNFWNSSKEISSEGCIPFRMRAVAASNTVIIL